MSHAATVDSASCPNASASSPTELLASYTDTMTIGVSLEGVEGLEGVDDKSDGLLWRRLKVDPRPCMWFMVYYLFNDPGGKHCSL